MMVHSTHNDQHRSAQGWAGGALGAAVSLAHTRADHKSHGGVHSFPVGASSFSSWLFDAPRKTSRGFGPGVFSQFMCCAHSPQFERRRRQVGADVLPRTRSVATNSLRDLNSGALAFHTADHSPCRVTDLPPVVQFRRLSSLVASDVKHRDREGFRNVRTPFQGARNDF